MAVFVSRAFSQPILSFALLQPYSTFEEIFYFDAGMSWDDFIRSAYNTGSVFTDHTTAYDNIVAHQGYPVAIVGDEYTLIDIQAKILNGAKYVVNPYI